MVNRLSGETLNGQRAEAPRPRRTDWIAFAVVTKYVRLQWVVLAATCACGVASFAFSWLGRMDAAAARAEAEETHRLVLLLVKK